MKHLPFIVSTLLILQSSFSVAHAADSRFVDMQNGTIYDSVSKLTWLKNAACFGKLTFNNALNKSALLSSGQCGLSGNSGGAWRIRQLTSYRY
jgi:hypothetical protein